MSLTSGPAAHIAFIGATQAELSALPKLNGIVWLSCQRRSERLFEFARDGDCIFRLDFANTVFAFTGLVAIVGRHATRH